MPDQSADDRSGESSTGTGGGGSRVPEGPGRNLGRALAPPAGEAWGIVGTLVAGAGFWGLAGFGLDRLLGFQALFSPLD
ncbi:hypothetical protein [Frankia sp. CcWB3]